MSLGKLRKIGFVVFVMPRASDTLVDVKAIDTSAPVERDWMRSAIGEEPVWSVWH